MDGLKKLFVIFALAVLVIGFSAPAMAQSGYRQPAGGQQQMAPPQGGQQQGGLKESKDDLMGTMANMTDLSLFVAALKATGYDKTLSQQEGPFMVYAPNNKAIEKDTGISDAESLTADPKALKAVVDNCIVSKVVEPRQGSDTFAVTAIGGKKITMKKLKNAITANGKNVVNVIKTENGILIVTDGIVGM